MKKIIENIKAQISTYQNGFSFRKSQDIFIPYLEIGIECLIRDVSNINLFFDTILKLIDIEVKDIYEIAQILGVSFEIIKEVVVDMVEGRYVYVSEHTLKITEKGKEALKTKQLVEIKKKNINRVMINLITGEICDGNDVKLERIRKNDVCLDKLIDVTNAFLDSNFRTINRVFQQQQESDSTFGKYSVNKELYKIVDISYESLGYMKNELFIYENDNSGDVLLQLQNDINDQYLNCLYAQLKDGTHPCLDSFFERDFNFVRERSCISINFDQELLDATNKLCSDLISIENLNTLSEKSFMQERYMVTDKEYISYFTFSDEIAFDKLIIITNRVNSILTSAIFDEIKRIAVKKPVILIYDEGEFNATQTVNYHLSSEKGNENIITITSKNIADTKVFFASALEINIEEKVMNAFGRAISYKTGKLKFNNNYKEENLKSVLTMYNIDELVQKQVSNVQANKKVKKKSR